MCTGVLGVRRYARVCAGICGYARVCVGVCGCARVCTGVRGGVQVCMGLRVYAWVCTGVCGYARVCACVWDEFSAHFNMYPIRIFLKIHYLHFLMIKALNHREKQKN